MDPNANYTSRILLPMPIIKGSRWWRNAIGERGRRLLTEFLVKKPAEKLANAQEETASQDLQTDFQKDQVTRPNDLLFKILILLPAESLFRIQFVCKNWFSLINSSIFIRSHAEQSESVLISQQLILCEDKKKSYFHFLDLDRGDYNFIESSVVELVDVRASCDGLVLATTETNKTLMLINPVTRKHIVLPPAVDDNFTDGSFGIAFDNEAKRYKLVHLFWEKSGRTGCEILSIGARNWIRMAGSLSELLVDITQIPVSIDGTLYWLPPVMDCEYFVSMNVQDQKFISRKLPVLSSSSKDRLLEIGGDLGYVNHAQLDLLQVWILITDDETRENWIKRYSINVSVDVRYHIPICCSRNGEEIVLESPHYELYVYNFGTGEMKLVRSSNGTWTERIEKHYIPHRNTLASV